MSHGWVLCLRELAVEVVVWGQGYLAGGYEGQRRVPARGSGAGSCPFPPELLEPCTAAEAAPTPLPAPAPRSLLPGGACESVSPCRMASEGFILFRNPGEISSLTNANTAAM